MASHAGCVIYEYLIVLKLISNQNWHSIGRSPKEMRCIREMTLQINDYATFSHTQRLPSFYIDNWWLARRITKIFSPSYILHKHIYVFQTILVAKFINYIVAYGYVHRYNKILKLEFIYQWIEEFIHALDFIWFIIIKE